MSNLKPKYFTSKIIEEVATNDGFFQFEGEDDVTFAMRWFYSHAEELKKFLFIKTFPYVEYSKEYNNFDSHDSCRNCIECRIHVRKEHTCDKCVACQKHIKEFLQKYGISLPLTI